MTETKIVYEVEDSICVMLAKAGQVEAYGSTITLPEEYRFGDIASVQNYVNRVLSHRQVVDQWGKIPDVKVERFRGHKRAVYRAPNIIAIPDGGTRWAMRECVVLHELSHHITDRVRKPGVTSHGKQFRDNYKRLVELIISPEVAWLLQAGWFEAGLK